MITQKNDTNTLASPRGTSIEWVSKYSKIDYSKKALVGLDGWNDEYEN